MYLQTNLLIHIVKLLDFLLTSSMRVLNARSARRKPTDLISVLGALRPHLSSSCACTLISSKFFPHINSPFSNPSVKATPYISSNSLHSLTKHRETLSHIASTSLPLTHFEPAFSTFCRNPNFLSRVGLRSPWKAPMLP